MKAPDGAAGKPRYVQTWVARVPWMVMTGALDVAARAALRTPGQSTAPEWIRARSARSRGNRVLVTRFP